MFYLQFEILLPLLYLRQRGKFNLFFLSELRRSVFLVVVDADDYYNPFFEKRRLKVHREIRRLTIDDYDDLIRLWADSGLPYRPFGRDARERIAEQMHRQDTAFIGVFEHGRLVAVGMATYDGRKGWINRVAVEPDHRRQGLAQEIIRECETFLEGRGAEVIACLIDEFNLPSMALFQKLGYLYHEGVYYFSKRKSPEV
jgi:ribosomal protein S18 acetylase RimI-like enzyme